MKKTKSVTCCIDGCENVFEVNINCSNNSSVCPRCKDKGFKSPTAKKAAENYKKTMLEKYGVENPSQIKSVVEKRKQTINKIKEENPDAQQEWYDKAKKTSIKRHGGHGLGSESIRQKAQQTLLETTGVDHPSKNKDVVNKRKETLFKKYGESNFMKTDQAKKQFSELQQNMAPEERIQINEKSKETNQKRYGVSHPSKLKSNREKAKKTNAENFGAVYATQNEQIKQKISDSYNSKSNEEKQQINKKRQETVNNKSQQEKDELRNKIRQTNINKFKPLLQKQLDYLDLELIDESYNGALYIHTFKCKKCGTIFEKKWFYIQQSPTNMCPKCYPANLPFSKFESEIVEFIKSISDFEIKQNDKKILNGLEVDIYIPSLKLGIEFDGLYWHSYQQLSKRTDGKFYHLTKTNLAEKEGIRLIHIFEDEWINKRTIVQNRLRNLLNCNHRKIHARKCIIKEIDKQTKNTFLSEYHIQGCDNSSINIGAFHEDELISVMTFSKGNIAKGSKPEFGVWELNRFCSIPDCTIPGIASKLLSYFKKNYTWKTIFSYADRRWSDGGVYKNLGFVLIKHTEPNYWYLEGCSRVHRFKYRKTTEEKTNSDTKEITEFSLRAKQNMFWIYDCGNLKFELKKQEE